MAQNNSNNTVNPPPKGSGNESGFGVEDKQKNHKKFPKGLLMGAFAAAALGGGVMYANLSREDPSTQAPLNERFAATALSANETFYGSNTTEYQFYQGFVSQGKATPDGSYITLSHDLTTISRVNSSVVNGVNGITYTDVTDQVQAADYNSELVLAGYQKREFSASLSYLGDLGEDFDPAIGFVKIANKDNYSFRYHIFKNEQGNTEIKIVNDAYQAAHSTTLEQASAQIDSMGAAAHIWDNAAPWGAFFTRLHGKCAQESRCEL